MKFNSKKLESRSCTVMIDISLSKSFESSMSDRVLPILITQFNEFLNLKTVNSADLPDGKLITMISNVGQKKEEIPNDSNNLAELKPIESTVASIKVYNRQMLIVITIEAIGCIRLKNERIAEWNEDLLNEIKGQLQLMLKSFDSVHIVCYPIVKRGNNFPRYLPLSDGRLVEYDFDELLFEHTSAFQNIKIVQSLSFGRTLLLDDVLNLAESDAIYTNTLLRKDCGDHYKDKEVLVLGGGDGAALNALLQDSPKHVTMVEIDCEVMNACRQYMPSVCGSVLDQWKGSNYEIIVDDCVPQLQQFVESGRKFDAIFNDLTDVPVGATTLDDQPKVWSFVRSVMSQCIRCLRPGGVCVAHATGSGAKSSLLKYEQMLQQQMPATVDISKRQVWVPSFLEFWVFFDVRLQSVHHSDVESDVAMVNK